MQMDRLLRHPLRGLLFQEQPFPCQVQQHPNSSPSVPRSYSQRYCSRNFFLRYAPKRISTSMTSRIHSNLASACPKAKALIRLTWLLISSQCDYCVRFFCKLAELRSCAILAQCFDSFWKEKSGLVKRFLCARSKIVLKNLAIQAELALGQHCLGRPSKEPKSTSSALLLSLPKLQPLS